MNTQDILSRLGLSTASQSDGDLIVNSPIDGSVIGKLESHDSSAIDAMIANSREAFEQWKTVPAPVRGELIRVFGNKLRDNKEALGALVTLECGKIYQEGLGEVQEMIDICDFALGLSRQLYGLTIASERPRSPDDGNLAPDGTSGCNFSVQLPGRRLELEHGAGRGLRQQRDLEALREIAADCPGL